MTSFSPAWAVIALALSAEPGADDGPNRDQNRGDLSGHYSGTLSARGPNDSLRSQQIHLKLRQRGSKITGSLGPKVDEQFPIDDGVIEGDRIRFTAKLGPGVIEFHLTVSAETIEGEMRAAAGAPPPFTRLSVRRVGELALSDLVAPLPYEGTLRSPRLLRLRLELSDGNNGALADFWREVEKSGTPLVEPVQGDETSFFATFLWRGAPETQNVLVFWQPFCFHQPDKYLMDHVERTDLWFRTVQVPRGARFSYQLSPDDPLGFRPPRGSKRNPLPDPLNLRHQPDGAGRKPSVGPSLAELPGAPAQPWYEKHPDVPRLTLEKHRLKSEGLGNEREILVYLPPGYRREARPYPLLFLFDGEDPDGLVFASWTIENLIAKRRIPPLVVVRIANPDQETRSRELACLPGFAEFLHGELVPFIRRSYRVTSEPSETILGGYSLGGLAAAYAGYRHPETFGLIISQSGSFWWEPTERMFAEPNWLAKQFIRSPKLPLRFYLDAGSFEIDRRGLGSGTIVPSRQMRDVLLAKGYEVHFQEFPGGHDYVNWRGTLADALIALIGMGSD